MDDITPNRRTRRRAQSAKPHKSTNAALAPEPEFAHLAHQLAVVYRAIEELVPYANNPRTHSECQIAKITASIRSFGFVNPILIDADGGVVAGHGRLEAAKQHGMNKVPTIRLDHLSEAEKRAYVIADNRLAELAGWDHGGYRQSRSSAPRATRWSTCCGMVIRSAAFFPTAVRPPSITNSWTESMHWQEKSMTAAVPRSGIS